MRERTKRWAWRVLAFGLIALLGVGYIHAMQRHIDDVAAIRESLDHVAETQRDIHQSLDNLASAWTALEKKLK